MQGELCTALLPATMLKFWPSTPADLTPRAAPNGHEHPNPFDLPAPPASRSRAASGSQTPTVSAAPSSSSAAPSYHHQLLSTPQHLLSPSASAAPTVSLAPSAPLTPGGSFFAAQPTTGLSLHAPVFNMQQPPPPKRSTRPPSSTASSTSTVSSAAIPTNSAGPSKGQIHVKLIQARGLNVPSSRSKPYVVVQFEQNEFVSRDPTDESDKEVKGTATVATLSRNSSSIALSALSSISSKAMGGPKSLFGRISAHNPVWKHEVTLSVPFAQTARRAYTDPPQRCDV